MGGRIAGSLPAGLRVGEVSLEQIAASRNPDGATFDLSRSDTSALPRAQNGLRDWVTAFLVCAIFAALQINELFSAGSLAFPPIFDDVNYFLSGAAYLKPFHDEGFKGILLQYLSNPPHAPLSTFQAFIGFSLLGVHAWVGPVVNAIILFLFVKAFLAVAADLAFCQALLLAVALLGFPIIGETLMVFKSDWFCALITAAGALFILLRPGWLSSGRDQLIAGALFGAALWAKPSVFPVTIGTYGAAMLLASLQAVWQRAFRAPALAILVTTATGILISLPYYALALGQTLDYIWTTAFGAQAHIWVQHFPLRDQLRFYLTGWVGRASLGLWLYAGPAIAIALLGLLWASGDRRGLYRVALVFAIVVIAYLGVTIPEFKGEHGAIFAALFFIATALAAVALVRRLPPILAWTACVLLLLFSGWQFMWPYTRVYGAPADPVFAASRWDMLHRAVTALGLHTESTIFLETTPLLYLNYSTVAFQDYVEGRLPPRADTSALITDLEEQRRKLATADIVFAPTPDTDDMFAQLPTASSAFRAKVIELIESTGRFGSPIRIADPLRGGAVLFYKAR